LQTIAQVKPPQICDSLPWSPVIERVGSPR